MLLSITSWSKAGRWPGLILMSTTRVTVIGVTLTLPAACCADTRFWRRTPKVTSTTNTSTKLGIPYFFIVFPPNHLCCVVNRFLLTFLMGDLLGRAEPLGEELRPKVSSAAFRLLLSCADGSQGNVFPLSNVAGSQSHLPGYFVGIAYTKGKGATSHLSRQRIWG